MPESALTHIPFRFSKRSIAGGFLGFLVLGFIATLLPFLLEIRAMKTQSITVKRRQSNNTFIEVKVGKKEKGWAPISRISRYTQSAVLIAEDDRFYSHFGIDFEEIATSISLNLKTKHYTRGASTITQQVIKTAFLSPEKSIARKIFEAIGALYLETIMTKREILEWYLNLVNFGQSKYGIQTASEFYFGTSSELLSVSQSVLLALILRSPDKLGKFIKAKNLGRKTQALFAIYLDRMLEKKLISFPQWQATMLTGNFGLPIQSYEVVHD